MAANATRSEDQFLSLLDSNATPIIVQYAFLAGQQWSAVAAILIKALPRSSAFLDEVAFALTSSPVINREVCEYDNGDRVDTLTMELATLQIRFTIPEGADVAPYLDREVRVVRKDNSACVSLHVATHDGVLEEAEAIRKLRSLLA